MIRIEKNKLLTIYSEPSLELSLKGFLNIMNIVKKIALTLSIAISLGAISATAYAEESVNVSETITYVELALADVNKSDFSAAILHLKAARSSSERITGNETVVKQANANVIQAQILSKSGDVQKSADELNKALVLYKTL
jgi:hypothetical protein